MALLPGSGQIRDPEFQIYLSTATIQSRSSPSICQMLPENILKDGLCILLFQRIHIQFSAPIPGRSRSPITAAAEMADPPSLCRQWFSQTPTHTQTHTDM